MAVRTCLFDMGDVLVRFCHDRMCAQIGALCNRPGPDVRRLLIDSGLQWEFERGRLDEAAFHARLQKVTGRDLDLHGLRRASADIFTPQPGIDDLIARLKDRGTRLVLFSNTCVTHMDFIRAEYSLFALFDDFVLSYEVGAIKPEPAIYEAALDRIACEPGECLYTDDRPDNIAGARPFGLDAVLFTGVADLYGQLSQRGLDLGRVSRAAG